MFAIVFSVWAPGNGAASYIQLCCLHLSVSCELL